MKVDDKKRLKVKFTLLVGELRVKDVQDFLYQEGVLTDEELELLENAANMFSNQQAVRKLVKFLYAKPEKAFKIFLEALRSAGYDHIAKALLEADLSGVNSDEVDSNLQGQDQLLLLQKQLQSQTELLLKVMDDMNELKKKHQDSVAESEMLKKKYASLEEALSNSGLDESRIMEVLKDMLARNMDGSLSETTAFYFSERTITDAASRVKGIQEHPQTMSTSSIAEEVAYDVVHFIIHGPRAGPPINIYAKTMRCLVEKIIDHYHDSFVEFVQYLDKSVGLGYSVLLDIADELLTHGKKWGTVITLYAFCGWVAKFCHDGGSVEAPQMVGDFLGYYVSHKVSPWIEDNGGWDSFVEKYSDRESTSGSGLSKTALVMIAGLGALTAAILLARSTGN